MTVGEICNRQVVTAHQDDTIADAARRMRDFHVGTLVVVEDQTDARRPIGILTDRDVIVGAVAEDGRKLDALRVRDVMSGELVTALEGESLLDGLKRMRSHVSDLAALLAGEQRREAVLR